MNPMDALIEKMNRTIAQQTDEIARLREENERLRGLLAEMPEVLDDVAETVAGEYAGRGYPQRYTDRAESEAAELLAKAAAIRAALGESDGTP